MHTGTALEIGWSRGTYGGQERSVQDFGEEIPVGKRPL